MLARVAILFIVLVTAGTIAAAAPDPFEGDPFKSFQWAGMKKEFIPGAKVVFDARVTVAGPQYADDPMNVPISIAVDGLKDVEKIMVLVDRNPIRKVLEYFPVDVLPRIAFRFKLEQASPVRVLAKTKDGVWHVGGTWVESAGGGCTVAGATRSDGSWSQTLGLVSGKVFTSEGETPLQSKAAGASSNSDLSRLKLRIMHPMDTGLVGGIPAFYLNKLQVADAQGRVLLRVNLFEPVSENPVFSFDFDKLDASTLVLTGTDNNGNRVHANIN